MNEEIKNLKEAFRQIIEIVKESQPVIDQLFGVLAENTKSLYNQLIAQGFSKEEAIQIVTAYVQNLRK